MNSHPDNIAVHIERLVLDGLPLNRAQGAAVQRAVEAELIRLLGQRGVADDLSGGAALAEMHIGTIHLTDAHSPADIGRHIARTVHAGIANRSPQPSTADDARHEIVAAGTPQGART